MNNLLSNIPTYISKKISDMVSQDPSILNLSIGEPYYSAPKKVLELLRQQINAHEDFSNISNKYADSKGAYNLRAEISKRYKRIYDADINENDEILVTHGAAEAIWLTVLTATSIGDEVMIANPSYLMYETAVRILGRIPVNIPTNLNDQGTIELSSLAELFTDKTKLLIINSPENPTGVIYNRDKIQELEEWTRDKGIYFAHDEVYDNFVFDDHHVNIFRYQHHISSNTIIINSFSKRYSMMGWRLGWLIGHKSFIIAATKIHTNLTLNLGCLHQEAAAKILNDEDVEKEMVEQGKILKSNLFYLKDVLTTFGGFDFSEQLPKGAFFLFPNISGLYEKIQNDYSQELTKGEAVADYLLKNYKIAVVPGIYYGQNGNNHVRIAVTIPREVIDKIKSRLLLTASIQE